MVKKRDYYYLNCLGLYILYKITSRVQLKDFCTIILLQKLVFVVLNYNEKTKNDKAIVIKINK